MLSTHKLRKELEFNAELIQLLDVLKGIAASQFTQLEKRKERFARFMEVFEGFLQMIDFNAVSHPLAKEQGSLGIIMITSNEGFMGGLNASIINTALDYPGADKAELIIIGERGAGYLKSMGRTFLEFPGISSEKSYEGAMELKSFIVNQGLSGEFSRLVLFYPKPMTFMVQKVEALSILPFSELFTKKENFVAGNIMLESSLHKIIEYLVGIWVAEKLLEVFEDSKLSEFSSRAVHLEESHQVLQQRGGAIRAQYFRSYHEMIDRGMRESFSAQSIRKKKWANSKIKVG